MGKPGTDALMGKIDGSRETLAAICGSLVQVIAKLELVDNVLSIAFKNRKTLKLWDAGQQCCEHRYMGTDDDLSDYIGGQLLDIELRDAPEMVDPYSGEAHEMQFLTVKTSKGEFVLANYNDHDGYYRGFYIKASMVTQGDLH